MEKLYAYTQMEDTRVKVERYIDRNGKAWVRVKFTDQARTEVILPANEFLKRYGNID